MFVVIKYIPVSFFTFFLIINKNLVFNKHEDE